MACYPRGEGEPDDHYIFVLFGGKLLKCILLNTSKTLGYVSAKVYGLNVFLF